LDKAEKLKAMFSTIVAAGWLAKERYGDGLIALLEDAENEAELSSLTYLLKALDYRTSNDLTLGAKEAAQQILIGWSLTPRDTVVVGVANGPKTCGSTAYLRAVETELPREWAQGTSMWTTFDSAFRKQDGRANLVIIDDFVGTGEKLSKLIEKLRSYPKTSAYKIHICCFAGMSAGAAALSALIGGEILVHCQYNRCISDRTIDPLKSELLGSMTSLEGKLFTKPGAYSLGYKQSESAFYLEGFNIPNNNFPVLWWNQYADAQPRPTLFPRR